MTVTQAPLEKQLVNIDLSKGIDERTRPELLGGITTLENLVSDQTGAWVKRPGMSESLISDGSGTGSAPMYPRKILSLLNGWGVIGDYGRLLHKQDSPNQFRARQYGMDFSSNKASFVGSSGPVRQDSFVSAGVKSCASGTTHDAYVSTGQVNSGGTGNNDKLTICERATGTETVYDLSRISWPSSGSSGNGACIVMVGDRYLHVYVTAAATATKISLAVIDIANALPASESSITAVNVATLGAGTAVIFDAVGGASRSWVLVGNSGGASNIYACDASTGVTLDTKNYPADVYTSIDADETAGNVWLMVAGATTVFTAVSTTNSATTTVARFTSANPGTYLCCNPTTGAVRIIYAYAATFGGSTVNSIEVLNIASGAVVSTVIGAAYGWDVCSKPWFMTTTGKYYVHLTKYDTTNEIGQHVIADISTFTQFSTNTSGLAIPFGNFRIACNLEPYFGMRKHGLGTLGGITSSAGFVAMRYRSVDGYEVSTCLPYQTAQRVEGIAFHRLRLNDAMAFGAANFSGSTYIAHGGLNSYDGRNYVDQGFADMPIVNSVTPGATPGNLSGSYRYVAVYRHVDANGVSTYSRTFGPVAAVNVAAATGKNNITIQPHSVTNRDDGVGSSVPFVELYRTKNAGTQYYLCATSQASSAFASAFPLVQSMATNATTGLLTVQDNLSDTNLASQAIMYRQPGTTNGPADRYCAPTCKFVIQHRDRLFCTDAYGQRVFYSSFFVDGEAAWFNPAFNFFVHAGTGPITGLASMDGRLFVFKRDAVFVVDGDGPGESGPAGNEFSPPQALAIRYGCIDHRSIVVTQIGIVYRSSRGIETLNRGLKLDWLGDRVQNTVDAYPITTGACVGPDSRIHIALALSETYAGSPLVNGIEVVYDLSAEAWSTGKHSSYLGSYGGCYQSIGVISDSGVEKIGYADNYQAVFMTEATSCTDRGYYVPFVVETGWIKQGPQARQRISDILFLAKKQAAANHALKISIAYNYSDTYTQTHTWEPGDINSLTIEELELQPATQQVLAIRVKIEDQTPADTVTYPVGTGAGCDILSITAEVAAKQGSPKLASGQKA